MNAGRDYVAGCRSRNLSIMVLAAVQNRVKSRSVCMLIRGSHKNMRSIISSSPAISISLASPMPMACACSATVVVGCRPLRDNWSQLSFCSPGYE